MRKLLEQSDIKKGTSSFINEKQDKSMEHWMWGNRKIQQHGHLRNPKTVQNKFQYRCGFALNFTPIRVGPSIRLIMCFTCKLHSHCFVYSVHMLYYI